MPLSRSARLLPGPGRSKGGMRMMRGPSCRRACARAFVTAVSGIGVFEWVESIWEISRVSWRKSGSTRICSVLLMLFCSPFGRLQFLGALDEAGDPLEEEVEHHDHDYPREHDGEAVGEVLQ